MKENPNIKLVPLTLMVDDISIVDDETFNQQDFLSKVKACPRSPKSACPSPEAYMQHFDCDSDVYVVTLSSQLSGSYNSAEVAKNIYLEDHPDKNIAIIDSRSASIGQTLITKKLIELIEEKHSFEEIVNIITAFRDEMCTKFVIETLETLRKNGRLSGLQAFIASALNIKPVMGATPEGTICKIDQARGIVKALLQMVKSIEQDVIKPHEKTLGIAHCNCLERAEYIKNEILKRIPFKDCLIVETAGVSSMYANEGGIIVCY